MKLSAKGRYALAASVYLAQHYNTNEYIPVMHISDELGISKIYLEQVFALLKRGEIVVSTKGAQGGYRLASTPKQLTALDILAAVETALFEKTDDTVEENKPEINRALHVLLFNALDTNIKNTLKEISLEQLVEKANENNTDEALMFYI